MTMTIKIPMNLTGKLTFVYVYDSKPAIWKELLYSIASIRKFYSKDAKIFVVGDNPKIKGVIHVPHTREGAPNGFSRAFDITKKLQVIIDTPEIPEDFVLMYDDIVLLRPVSNEAFVPRYSMGVEDENKVFSGVQGKPSINWKSMYQNTIKRLQKFDRPTYNYETHLPRILNKGKLSKLMKQYRLHEIPYLFSTLYFNTYYDKPDIIITEPQFKHIKYGCYSPKSDEILDINTPGKVFLNYNNSGLNKELKAFIHKTVKG